MGKFPSNIQDPEVSPPFVIVLAKQIPSSFNTKANIPTIYGKRIKAITVLGFILSSQPKFTAKKNMAELVINGLYHVNMSASYVCDSCLFIDIIMTPLTGPGYI